MAANFSTNHRPATPFLRFERSRPDRPDFFLIQKEIFGGGNIKKCKSQDWRGGSALGWQTVGLAFISRFVQNRFGLAYSSPPSSDFLQKLSAFALFFVWLRAAQTKGFSGGKWEIAALQVARFFVFWSAKPTTSFCAIMEVDTTY